MHNSKLKNCLYNFKILPVLFYTKYQYKWYLKFIIHQLILKKVVQMTKATQAASNYQKIVQQVITRDFKQSTTLAPMEIKLQKIDNINQFRQVHRESDSPDKIEIREIHSILQDGKPITCLSKFKQFSTTVTNINGQQQLFQFHPKLAVCVCAYNEDKQMLQQTLKGIYSSLINFQKSAGIKTQEIVVLVIFDGIQNVKRGQYEEDMITFFDQVDYTNGSVLKQGEQSFQTLLNKGVHPDNIDWRKTCSMRENEIEINLKRRFRTKYDDYMSFLKIKKQCSNKNKTYEVQKLIPAVKSKYNQYRNQYIQKKVQQEISQYKEILRKIFDKRFNQDELKTKKKQLQLQFQEQFNVKRKEQIAKRRESSQLFHSKVFDGTFSLRQNCIEKAYKNILDLADRYFDSRKQTSLIYPIQYRPNPNYQSSLEQQMTNVPKLNVLLCIKHKNAGKLSSHALFFLGFCEFMKPDICLLMDVGLQPLDNAIYKMFEYMDKYPNTGGVCGYMGLKVQKLGDEFGVQSNMDHIDGVSYYFHQQIFSVQKAQLFQYHMGHLIDKPFEAAFNFIHVLPGAFSCYRYQALAGKNLDHYLQPALQPDKERTLEERNMFLAEDRTLSLVLKQNGRDFAYLPTAKAVVDPAGSLVVLMAQRRRWINGSWYAFFQVFGKRQNIHDIGTRIQFLYYYFIHGLTYISISLFYVSLFLTVQSVLGNIVQTYGYSSKYGQGLVIQNITTCVICFIYIVMNGGLIFLSLQVKNNDKRFQRIYYFISFFLGIYGLLVTALMLYNILILITNGGWNAPIFNQNESIIPNSVTRAFMIGTVVMYGSHVVLSFDLRIMLEMLGSTIHYIFYAPTYLHVLMIYAFCKIDDFSWGTKGLQTSQNVSKSQELKKLLTQNKVKKFFHVYKYMGINTIIALILVIIISYKESKGVFIAIFSGMLFTITVFRFIISNCYLLKYYLRNCSMTYTTREREVNLERGIIIQKNLKKRLEEIKQETKKQIISQIQQKFNVNASTIRKRKNK